MASLGKYGEVLSVANNINLSSTTLLSKDFASIVSDFLKQTSSIQTVIYFDELDKWLFYNIEYNYAVEKEKKEKNREKEKDNEKELDFGEYKRSKKQKFLYELLELLETKVFEAGVIFVFCSNNFHTIFEDIDMTHFKSLRTRFTPLKFNRCYKKEFVEYVRYFNTLMRGTSLYYEPHDVEEIVKGVKNNLAITYRALNHCHINAGYDIRMLAEVVNRYESENSLDCFAVAVSVDGAENDEICNNKEDFESIDIFYAVINGKLDQLKDILAKGGDVNVRYSHGRETCLHLAALYGHVECIQILLDEGQILMFRIMINIHHQYCMQ